MQSNPAPKEAPAPEFGFSEKHLEEIRKYTTRLSTEEWLIERVASSRNWKPETIQGLALSNHLGWAGDALAFIYKTGVKLREWPGREIRWMPGHGFIWRADVLENATTAYLTEGEIDAITLLDIGLENKAGVAVVAAPSSTTFRESWAELFTGKDVILCYDLDDAGRAAVERVGPLLSAVAKSVVVWNPKEAK